MNSQIIIIAFAVVCYAMGGLFFVSGDDTTGGALILFASAFLVSPVLTRKFSDAFFEKDYEDIPWRRYGNNTEKDNECLS